MRVFDNGGEDDDDLFSSSSSSRSLAPPSPMPVTAAPPMDGPRDPLARDLYQWLGRLDDVDAEAPATTVDPLLRAHLAGALFTRCLADLRRQRRRPSDGVKRARKARDRTGTADRPACPGCYWRTEAYVARLQAQRGKGKAGPRLKVYAGSCQYLETRSARRRDGPPAAGAEPVCDGCYATWMRDSALMRLEGAKNSNANG